MYKRLNIIAALVLISTVIVCSGCGKQRTDVTTIRFATWGNDIAEKSMRGYIAEFEKLHPNIKVELQITPWSRMFDKLMISSAGGRPPDVARISSEWFVPLAAKGLLEPLAPYVERDNFDIEDFYPQAVDGWGKYKGTLYGIPDNVDIYALYYNVDMFDKYKIPYPDWTWDWDTYLAVAKKLTKDTNGDGKLDQWGCGVGQWWQEYIHQSGGYIVNADCTECLIDQPESYRGIQFMSDLINKYHVSPNASETANIGAMKLFTSGKIGMMESGSWAAELFFKNEIKDFKYDVAPLPKGPGRRSAFIGGASISVLARSRHKDAAWEFAKYMTGKKVQIDAILASQVVPSRISIAESGAFIKQNSPPKNRKVFVDMIQYGEPNPAVACSNEMNQIILSEFELVKLGKVSGKTACKKLKPVVDELLRNSD